MDIFRAHAHVDLAADVAVRGKALQFARGHLDAVLAEHGVNAIGALFQFDAENVHLRRADKAGHEEILREIVEVLRRIVLLHDAILHQHDARAHGHGLGLIVGDVDEGGLEALVELGDLRAHLHAQFGVQVGQRLVHQKHLWLAHDGAAQGHALALAAGKRGGLAVEKLFDAEDLRRLAHAAVDLRLGRLAQFEGKGHVVVHGHVRIEGVALKHHGDVAVLGQHVVDQFAVDIQFAFGDLLQAGDHAQRGGLAAARGADQHHEFLILDLQIKILDSSDVARIDLPNIAQRQACHAF